MRREKSKHVISPTNFPICFYNPSFFSAKGLIYVPGDMLI